LTSHHPDPYVIATTDREAMPGSRRFSHRSCFREWLYGTPGWNPGEIVLAARFGDQRIPIPTETSDDGIAVTTLHRVVSDRRCGPGVRWRLCHSASTSSCSRHPLTTLSGRLKDHAVRITFSWVALSVVVLSVGLLLVASLDDSLFIKARQSGVPEPSVPPTTGVSVAPTAALTTPTPPSTPPAPTAGMPSGRPAAMPSEQPAPPPAPSAPAPPAATAPVATAPAPSARAAPVPSEQPAAATSPDRSHAFCAPASHPAGADGCCAVR
jgi:hypothetical protein